MDVGFENWGISPDIPQSLPGCIRSHDLFRPIAHEKKYLMNYNCGYWPFKSVRFSSFQVSNMDADIPYKFNIVNCEKINSQFNFGKLVS